MIVDNYMILDDYYELLNLNIDEKRKIILDNISPFIANEEDIMKIITKVNALYHE